MVEVKRPPGPLGFGWMRFPAGGAAVAPVVAILAAALLALGGITYALLRGGRAVEDRLPRASLSVSDVLGGPADSGYARALEPRAFEFPRDHGPHPAFRTEWWYLTGNLEDAGGRPFGFHFTLFRSALRPPGDEEDPTLPRSGWSTDQVYMGHLAITNGAGRRFHAFERFSRGALDLAGATWDPFRVWLEDWELGGPQEGAVNLPESLRGAPGLEVFPLRLRALEGGVGLELSFLPVKPMVLQGEEGLSQKGPEPGNASFYYAFTRLTASGIMVFGPDTIPVRGSAWMDREWSTSALSSGQVGWDWFALQLEDGYDLMYYQLRREDGSADPLSKGSLVDREGVKGLLSQGDVILEVLDLWRSPVDGAAYPARWRLSVPHRDMTLEITPLMPNQELNLTFRYWEGAVRVAGTREGRPVAGRGYVELTGYGVEEGDVPEGRGTGRQAPTRTGG
jgi:predicted secreted hydrolase